MFAGRSGGLQLPHQRLDLIEVRRAVIGRISAPWIIRGLVRSNEARRAPQDADAPEEREPTAAKERAIMHEPALSSLRLGIDERQNRAAVCRKPSISTFSATQSTKNCRDAGLPGIALCGNACRHHPVTKGLIVNQKFWSPILGDLLGRSQSNLVFKALRPRSNRPLTICLPPGRQSGSQKGVKNHGKFTSRRRHYERQRH